MKKAIFNWSGGKDSALCLHKVLQQNEYDIASLLTSVNTHYERVSMHGVRISLLEKQAQSLDLPLYQLRLPEMPSMEEYNDRMEQTMNYFRAQGVTYSIFGDIFLEDLRQYREDRLNQANISGVFPLWKIPGHQLMHEFIDQGFKAVLVCINARYLDRSFVGREIDADLLRDLPPNVDVCGENGEYHSFVYDGPIFRRPVAFTKGEIVYRNYAAGENAAHDTGFWYIDLLDA
jgi:uncharacterized protein (TIGR00290 family)